MADFTETPFAEDFQLQLNTMIDDFMEDGMARETAVMVLQMAIIEVMTKADEEENQ